MKMKIFHLQKISGHLVDFFYHGETYSSEYFFFLKNHFVIKFDSKQEIIHKGFELLCKRS